MRHLLLLMTGLLSSIALTAAADDNTAHHLPGELVEIGLGCSDLSYMVSLAEALTESTKAFYERHAEHPEDCVSKSSVAIVSMHIGEGYSYTLKRQGESETHWCYVTRVTLVQDGEMTVVYALLTMPVKTDEV